MYRVDINHRKIVWGLVIVFSSLLFLTSSVHAGWTVVSLPDISSNWLLDGVHFTSSTEGWAVGWDYQNYKPVLFHYLSGSWTTVHPPDSSSQGGLNAVHFTSPSDGWAVGFNFSDQTGFLFHYSDGVWTSVDPPIEELEVGDVYFKE